MQLDDAYANAAYIENAEGISAPLAKRPQRHSARSWISCAKEHLVRADGPRGVLIFSNPKACHAAP